MTFVSDWRKTLGYKQDPFEPVVFSPVRDFIVGADALKKDCNLFLIKEGRYGTLIGDPGTGKTTFLRWMQEELPRGLKPHYVQGKKPLIPQLVHSLGVLARFSARNKSGEALKEIVRTHLAKGRNVILVDDADSLHESEFLLSLPCSLIAADVNKPRWGPKDELGATIPAYSEDDLLDMVAARIRSVGGRGILPFEEQELRGLVKKAGNHPRKLLELARERAIELSLQQRDRPKRKFVAITIEKGKPHKTQPKAQEKMIDQDELAAIVEPERPVREEEFVSERSDSISERELEKLLAGLGKEQPATPKKPAKKAAAKAPKKRAKSAKKKR